MEILYNGLFAIKCDRVAIAIAIYNIHTIHTDYRKNQLKQSEMKRKRYNTHNILNVHTAN